MNLLRPIDLLLACVFLLIALMFPGETQAQQFRDYQIIDGLALPRGIERSGASSAPLPAERRALDLRSGAKDGLTAKSRSDLSDLVARYDLPRIDTEINFNFNSAVIAPQALPLMDQVGRALSSPQLAQHTILIAGHTDAVGSAAYNQTLSAKRAASVRSYLVRVHGIGADRLLIAGFGFERPKDLLDPKTAINRRVEFINITGLVQ